MAQLTETECEVEARRLGWTTKRDDGSLNAGVVRYSGRGFQWGGDWREALAISNFSPIGGR